MRAVLIGLTGHAGAGKSTAAHYLNAVHGFTRTRFAGPLKDMLRALGLTEDEIEGDRKEEPCARLGGASPRWAMQSLGTEWGRDLIHSDLWTIIWQDRARALLKAGHSVCVEDVRFPNEVAAIKELGGRILRVRTHDLTPAGDHISEQHDLPYDVSVLNDWHSLDVFHSRLDGALDMLGGDHD